MIDINPLIQETQKRPSRIYAKKLNLSIAFSTYKKSKDKKKKKLEGRGGKKKFLPIE